MRLRTIYTDEAKARLFPSHGQPALAPWRLALVTVFQFMEGLTVDRLRMLFVIGWLGNTPSAWTSAILALIIASSPNFAHVCWISFWSGAERVDSGTAHGRQRTDSTHVLAKIRALNRTLCVGQTMVYVLNVLSQVAPEWVRAYVPTEWVERYGERLEHERLPKEEEERKKYANQVGVDGWTLLDALDASSTADWLKTLPAIMTLRTSLPTTVRTKRARWAMAN